MVLDSLQISKLPLKDHLIIHTLNEILQWLRGQVWVTDCLNAHSCITTFFDFG